jgi:uncharacterized membrane protein
VSRKAITLTMLLVGIVLVIVSYFFLSAPWGADSVRNSNPRMQFAPALLVLGVIMAFSSAVVYELLPDRGDPTPEDSDE